jgi:hypothetical protein
MTSADMLASHGLRLSHLAFGAMTCGTDWPAGVHAG